jgi:Bifunctional DNA primase/polymerase, N-terminal
MTKVDRVLRLARHVAVFPCRNAPGDKDLDKTPLTPHGFLDASSDAEVIRRWWGQWPDALIGAPAGGKFIVVDADLQHLHAQQWLADNRDRLPLTRTHRTRSGGRHFLFRPHPQIEIKCSAGKLHPNIDVRAAGGYIIWWPAEGFDVLHSRALEDLPDWIIEALRPKPAPVVHLATARPVSQQQAERQLDGIVRTVACAPIGQRNAILHWGSCRLWELVDCGELSEGMARGVMLAAAARTGLSASEVERTFNSARRSVRGAA